MNEVNRFREDTFSELILFLIVSSLYSPVFSQQTPKPSWPANSTWQQSNGGNALGRKRQRDGSQVARVV